MDLNEECLDSSGSVTNGIKKAFPHFQPEKHLANIFP